MSKEQTIAQTFAEFFCKAQFKDVPPEVVHKAKLLTIDLIGVSIAGLKMDFPGMMIDYLSSLRGTEQATLFGFKEMEIRKDLQGKSRMLKAQKV